MEFAVLVVILEVSVYSVVIIANILAKSAEGNKETNPERGKSSAGTSSGHGW